MVLSNTQNSEFSSEFNFERISYLYLKTVTSNSPQYQQLLIDYLTRHGHKIQFNNLLNFVQIKVNSNLPLDQNTKSFLLKLSELKDLFPQDMETDDNVETKKDTIKTKNDDLFDSLKTEHSDKYDEKSFSKIIPILKFSAYVILVNNDKHDNYMEMLYAQISQSNFGLADDLILARMLELAVAAQIKKGVRGCSGGLTIGYLLGVLDIFRRRESGLCVLVTANCIISLYLRNGQFKEAHTIISGLKSVSSSEYKDIRHEVLNLFLHAKTDAFVGKYHEALKKLDGALLKVPKQKGSGISFAEKESLEEGSSLLCGQTWLITQVLRLKTIVLFILGDFPDSIEEIFGGFYHWSSIKPYFDLFEIVKLGQMEKFESALKLNADLFKRDGLFSLVESLKEATLKKAVKNICTVYSKISLADISLKLACSSSEEAEQIIQKAIDAKSINGRISEGCFLSSKSPHVYSTTSPVEAVQKRIAVCKDFTERIQKSHIYPEYDENNEIYFDEKLKMEKLFHLLGIKTYNSLSTNGQEESGVEIK